MQSLIKLLRRPLLHVAGVSFFVNLLMLVPAIFMLQVFDRVLSSRSGETLTVLLIGVGVALLLLLVLDYLRSRLQGVAGNLVAESLSPAVTRLVVAQGALRHGRPNSDRLRDIGSLRALFSAQGLLAVFDAPWVVVYVAVIWLAHPALGMAAAGAAVLMLVLAIVNDLLTRKNIEELQKAAAHASQYLEASLQNSEVAQTMGMTSSLISRWRHKNAEVTALQGPTASRSVAMAALTRTLRQAIQVLMLALGAYLVINNEATAGVMIATTTLLGRALAPVEMIVGSWRVLADGRAAFGRLSALFEQAASEPPRMELPPPTGALSVHQLVFRPQGTDRVILGGVSLQLAAGESLAIIGPSGAGKSTLVRLLTGVWKATSGTVRLDGADMATWPREALGPYIGYVPQDVELFPGRIGHNIARLGKVDGAKVVVAAKAANVHELILSLPDGYDTLIEPGSALLSPGQRQRIALARALYGDPKLIILDEPNANLDGAGEVALGQALAALRGKVTVVVVTHRTTLVQHIDKLLVLEGGRVTQYGPAADVMKAMNQQAMPRPATAGAQVVDMPLRAPGLATAMQATAMQAAAMQAAPMQAAPMQAAAAAAGIAKTGVVNGQGAAT